MLMIDILELETPQIYTNKVKSCNKYASPEKKKKDSYNIKENIDTAKERWLLPPLLFSLPKKHQQNSWRLNLYLYYSFTISTSFGINFTLQQQQYPKHKATL